VKKIQTTRPAATDEAFSAHAAASVAMFPAQYAGRSCCRCRKAPREALPCGPSGRQTAIPGPQDEITRNYVSKYETTDDE